jgi:sterol carrier protein 2
MLADFLGLCPQGSAEKFIRDQDNTYGGKYVTNPSGGLLQRVILWAPRVWLNVPNWFGNCADKLRDCQVDDVHIALPHNLGLGSTCVVTL